MNEAISCKVTLLQSAFVIEQEQRYDLSIYLGGVLVRAIARALAKTIALCMFLNNVCCCSLVNKSTGSH